MKVSMTELKEKNTNLACVLLSGGMDSSACLHWAIRRSNSVRAIGFDYGQPMRDAELTAAGKLAQRRGIPFELIHLGDTMHLGILSEVPDHSDEVSSAVSRAFVPGRNAVFLSSACARAAQWWPIQSFDLVIGACGEDAAGFPDCRPEFMVSAQAMLSCALGRNIRVQAPFVSTGKVDILREASKDELEDLVTSWSCYAGRDKPCERCSACVLRARAFDAVGVADRCKAPIMTGGDVARDRKLRE